MFTPVFEFEWKSWKKTRRKKQKRTDYKKEFSLPSSQTNAGISDALFGQTHDQWYQIDLIGLRIVWQTIKSIRIQVERNSGL
jgi:hypothetical protein